MRGKAPGGVVYLVHFSASPSTEPGGQLGIGWKLARTWEGSRQRERQLKRRGGASRRCPICRAERKAKR
jgi:hypothetical protein